MATVMRASDLSPELVRRLIVPGPRYTSYPPANIWADFDPGTYAAALGRLGASGEPHAVSIYVHVPFCRVRCGYCALNVSGSRDPKRHAAYVDAIIREAERVQERAGGTLRACEIAWGGGTPTTLSPSELTRLAEGVARSIPSQPGARMSVEVDPRTTGREKLDALVARGFRRLSMGVQDVDPVVQEAAGRMQPEAMSRGCLELARAAGFEGVGVDLIYGLPRQHPEQFASTVETIISWGPERLSLFGYAHLPSRFANQRRIDETALPGPLERLDLLLLAAGILERAGYHWLGLDHFVREDDELWIAHKKGALGRNFMGYVPGRAGSLIGLGASAIGEVDDIFVQNRREEREYVSLVESGTLATARGYALRDDDVLRGEVIERIMCQLEVDLEDVAQRHQTNAENHFAALPEALRSLEEDALVERRGMHIRVTPLGRPFLRNICMVFDAHRADEGPTERRHSPTV